MIKTIDIGFKKVDKILHVADIHIRNYQRHKEYREVFKHLYKAAKELPVNSLIYVPVMLCIIKQIYHQS